MKDKPAYTVVFSLVLGLVCATLLTVVGAWTRPYAEANRKAEEVRKILDVLQVPVPRDAAASELVRIFEERVRKRDLPGAVVYEYIPEGALRPEAVAIEFQGPGLWGPIRGVIALEADLSTVRGIVFTHQEETPGLGGEIESDAFRNQFPGKKVRNPRGEIGLHIRAPGAAAAADDSTVDGISGATLTCTKLERMLNAALRRALGNSGANDNG